MSSLKVKNKKRKAAAADVVNNAAARAAWGAIGLSAIPAAHIKPGHSNAVKRRGTGRNKTIIRDSCMTRGFVDVAKCRRQQLFLGPTIEAILKEKPGVRLYRCSRCKLGPYTYEGRASHKSRCTVTGRAVAKAIQKVPAAVGAEMEERNSAIRTTHHANKPQKKRPKTSSASVPGFNAGATSNNNGGATADDDMELDDGDDEYAEADEPSVAYDDMFKAAAIKVGEKIDKAYRSRTSANPVSIPEAYAHNPMMRSRHWVNDMTQVSGFVGPAFILVWAPDLWWNRQAIPKALRLRPGVNNPEAQFMVCPHGCGGHLIVKGSWVARTVMGFGEDGAIIAKQMACSTCNRRVMPWDPLLLETLPRHVQDDFPIVMYKKFLRCSKSCRLLF